MSQCSVAVGFMNVGASNANSSANKVTTNKSDNQSFKSELKKAKDSQEQPDDKNQSINASTDKVENKTTEKVTNEQDTKNDDVANSKPANEGEEVLEDETISDTSVSEEIVAAISQILDIPVEELQSMLDSLGIEAVDLGNEEVFSQFISKLYEIDNLEGMLTSELPIADIKELFAKIQEMVNTMLPIEEKTKPLVGTDNVASHENAENVKHEAPNSEETQGVEENINTINVKDKLTPVEDESLQVSDSKEDAETYIRVPASKETQASGSNDSFNMDSNLLNTQVHSIIREEYAGNVSTGFKEIVTTTMDTIDGQEIVKQINFKLLGSTNEVDMMLSPKELGKMSIKIVETNSSLVADIKVENEKVKEVLLNEIEALKESLSQQGISVAEVRVDISNNPYQSQMEQQRQKSSKRIQDIIAKHFGEESEEGEEEPEMVTAQSVSNSEVDYSI